MAKKKVDPKKEKIELELERRTLQHDASWNCPCCGGATDDAEDDYQDESLFKDRVCYTCDIRLGVVYRMHYQFASGLKKGDPSEYNSVTVETPWDQSSDLMLLSMMLKGMHMQNYMMYNKDIKDIKEDRVAQIFLEQARKVPKEEWPRVLASGIYHEDMCMIARYIMQEG